jgi:hypothetical protein
VNHDEEADASRTTSSDNKGHEEDDHHHHDYHNNDGEMIFRQNDIKNKEQNVISDYLTEEGNNKMHIKSSQSSRVINETSVKEENEHQKRTRKETSEKSAKNTTNSQKDEENEVASEINIKKTMIAKNKKGIRIIRKKNEIREDFMNEMVDNMNCYLSFLSLIWILPPNYFYSCCADNAAFVASLSSLDLKERRTNKNLKKSGNSGIIITAFRERKLTESTGKVKQHDHHYDEQGNEEQIMNLSDDVVSAKKTTSSPTTS